MELLIFKHTQTDTDKKKNCIVQYPVKLRFQNVRQSLPYITEGRYAKTVDKNGKGKGRRATNHWRQIAGNKSIAPPPRLLYVRKREIEIEREPVPIVRKDGWASGLARPGEENLVPTGAQSPNRQPLSELLYRPQLKMITVEAFSYAKKIFLSAS